MAEVKTELQRNAMAEARNKELTIFQRALDVQWLNSRMEDGRMGRTLALIAREAELEKEHQERTDHAAIVNAKARKEIDLGKEIADIRHDEICKLQRRHYLRDRDPSLKVLVKKLEASYVCRDQQQQILHNQYKRIQEKVEEDRNTSTLRNALYNDLEQAEKEAREDMAHKMEYGKELQQQLVNRQRQRQCQFEEALIEKKMLDDIMRTIYDEDMRELKQKREQMEKLRAEMKSTQEVKKAWKEKQKVVLMKEAKNIELQAKAVADRNSAIIAERERINRIKEEINQRIGAKILADAAERQAKLDIIALLQHHERLEQYAQDDARERAAAERARRDAADAHAAQAEARRRDAAALRDAAARQRAQTEAMMKVLDDKERIKEEKTKERKKKYAEDLKQQIKDNEVRRKRDAELEEKRVQMVWDYDKAWRAEVAAERAAVLRSHAPAVLGRLQAGLLRRADLPGVAAGAAERPAAAHLAPAVARMAGAARPRPRPLPKCNEQCKIIRDY